MPAAYSVSGERICDHSLNTLRPFKQPSTAVLAIQLNNQCGRNICRWIAHCILLSISFAVCTQRGGQASVPQYSIFSLPIDCFRPISTLHRNKRRAWLCGQLCIAAWIFHEFIWFEAKLSFDCARVARMGFLPPKLYKIVCHLFRRFIFVLFFFFVFRSTNLSLVCV